MNKYNAKKVTHDNVVFDSIKEGNRYLQLRTLFRAGQIYELTLQPEYEFTLDGEKMFSYFADFSYTEKNGTEIIEDSKGFRTPIYKLKKRLIEKQHGIRITET